MNQTVLLFILVFIVQGCSLLHFKRFVEYDSRSFSVVTASLFNQRIPPNNGTQNWKGDWLFRRQRLDLIDKELYRIRPDILIFQEHMARRGSPSESDRNILSFGSLDGYQWSSQKILSHEDSQEDQFLSVAAGLPFRLTNPKSRIRMRELGIDGFISATPLILEEQELLVVNVQLPTNSSSAQAWYQVIEEFILEQIAAQNVCLDRLIVGGYFSSRQGEYYDRFLANLRLKDSADGFCELATECITSSLTNDIMAATQHEGTGFQTDRILVPNNAIVYSGQIVFNQSTELAKSNKYFGIAKLWPTRRFGWNTSLRIKSCR